MPKVALPCQELGYFGSWSNLRNQAIQVPPLSEHHSGIDLPCMALFHVLATDRYKLCLWQSKCDCLLLWFCLSLEHRLILIFLDLWLAFYNPEMALFLRLFDAPTLWPDWKVQLPPPSQLLTYALLLLLLLLLYLCLSSFFFLKC